MVYVAFGSIVRPHEDSVDVSRTVESSPCSPNISSAGWRKDLLKKLAAALDGGDEWRVLWATAPA